MKLRDFGVCVELRATRFLQRTESQILYMFISFSKSYSDFSSCFFPISRLFGVELSNRKRDKEM